MAITTRPHNMIIRSIEERDRYLEDRLLALRPQFGAGPIAVYGAGQHTHRMIERCGALLPGVAFILDDNEGAWGQTIGGVAVCNPQEVRPEDVTAVLISSDAAEGALAAKAAAWVAQVDDEECRQPAVLRVYEGCAFAYEKRADEQNRHTGRGHKLGPFFGAHRLEPKFNALYDEALAAADVGDNEWRRARFYNLVNLLKLTSGIEGYTAEAGCFRGQSSYLICRVLADEDASFDGSAHVIVDSFEGLSEPTGPDGAFSVKRYEAGAFANTSVAHVRNTLQAFPRVRIHQGWIPGVLGALEEDAVYRFVHVDVDLYEPVKDCLEYFYPRLAGGGLIVVDDHGPVPNGSYPGCAIACREFCEKYGVPFAPLCAGNAVFVKRG